MAAGRPVPLVCRGIPPDVIPYRGCHKQGMAGRTACHRSRQRSLTLCGRYAPFECPLTLRLEGKSEYRSQPSRCSLKSGRKKIREGTIRLRAFIYAVFYKIVM